MVRWKLLQKENLKFPNSKLHTVPEKMLYHQRYSTDLQKLFFCWKMWKIGIWIKNFSGRSYFSFAMVRWKLLQKEKFDSISQFQAAHCARKNAISPKVFNRSSKTFLLLKDVENRYLHKKFSGRSYFSFAMVRWKLFSKWKNSKFPTFKLYTVSEKMLYHQRYSTDLQKLFFCWKMWKIGIWIKNLVGAAILVLQW